MWLIPSFSSLCSRANGAVIWHFLLDARVCRLSEAFQHRYMSERFGFLLKPDREGVQR